MNQLCAPRKGNPGNVLLTSRNRLKHFYQRKVLLSNKYMYCDLESSDSFCKYDESVIGSLEIDMHSGSCGFPYCCPGNQPHFIRLKDFSTLDFSTPSFNPGPFNPRLFNYEIFNPERFTPGLFNHNFLNHGVEKFMVEKSGVEMSSL